MEYFLQLFGALTIERVVMLAGAIGFVIGCYKKMADYLKEKTVREKEKDDRIRKVIDQTEKYPEWHQQSIDIRDSLSDAINALNKKMDDIKETLEAAETKRSEEHATSNRYRILRFDDEIRHGEHHTKEHFDQILDDITEYQNFCRKHPLYENNKATMAIENIKRVYEHCAAERDFL